MNTPLIKWTGSKRCLAPTIISHFPSSIGTYYEPFVGGGSVFLALLRFGARVGRFRISDVNGPLIGLYRLVASAPERVVEDYARRWGILQGNSGYFYLCREEFNQTQDPLLLYFLTRTCYNGAVRYNGKGEFNVSHHFSRPGMHPKQVGRVVGYYHDLMRGRDITFKAMDFGDVRPEGGADVVYADPPYTATKALYHGNIDLSMLYGWLDRLPCNWYLTLNGINVRDSEEVLPIPYTQKVLLPSGTSAFSRLKRNRVSVGEYFYCRERERGEE